MLSSQGEVSSIHTTVLVETDQMMPSGLSVVWMISGGNVRMIWHKACELSGLGLGLVVLTAKYEIIEVGTKSSTCLKVIGDWTRRIEEAGAARCATRFHPAIGRNATGAAPGGI